MRQAAHRRGGFTLLEVMIALGILAALLTGITLTVQQSLRASQHARMMSTATYLCRQRMIEIEEDIIVNGFTDSSGGKEEKGQFDEPNKRFRWLSRIEQIHLPSTDQIQSAATKAVEGQQTALGSTGSGQSAAGGSGSGQNASAGLGSMVGPVKDILEQGIRRVSLKVMWDEPGRQEQLIEVVSFYTDMRRIPL